MNRWLVIRYRESKMGESALKADAPLAQARRRTGERNASKQDAKRGKSGGTVSKLKSVLFVVRPHADDFSNHQESSVEHFSTGVFSPRTIFSRILGIERRYSVSWIASQSSIYTRTPAFFFPTMWIGSWDFSDSDRSSEILAFFASTVFMLLSPQSLLRYLFCRVGSMQFCSQPLLSVALTTLSLRAMKAATANPVESLRYE